MPSPDQSIRVVNAARRLTDIAALSDEELTVLLRDIPVEDEKERQVLLAFHNIVKRRRDAQRTRPTPTAIPLLAARQLMYDVGVVPFGLVASNADDVGTETRDTIRVPYPKELWMDKPPKSAAGMGLTAWTTSVSPADGIDLEGLVVLPSRLGRPPQVTGTPADRDTIITQDNATAAAARSSFLHGFKPAAEVKPDLVNGRLRKAHRREAIWVDGVSDLSDAGRMLIALYSFAETSAGDILAGARLSRQVVAQANIAEGSALVEGTVLADALNDGAPLAFVHQIRAAPAAVKTAYEDALKEAAKLVFGAIHRTNVQYSVTPMALAVYLMGAGAEKVAHYIMAGEEEQVTHVVARIRSDHALAVAERRAIETELRNAAHARQYLTIIERKLGTERFQEVTKYLQASPLDRDANDPESVLSAVRATNKKRGKIDAETVQLEYENQVKNWQAEANNKCGHVALVRRLRASVSVDQQQAIIRELHDWMAPGSRDSKARSGKGQSQGQDGSFEWVMCRNCKMRVICPHVLELYDLRRQHAPYERIRRSLAKYSDPTMFAAPGKGLDYAYYCRVCSEEIFTRTGNDEGAIETLGSIGSFDDELRSWLWGRVFQIVDSRRPLLRFSPSIEPGQFAREVVDVCHPLAVSDVVDRRTTAAGLIKLRRGGRSTEVDRLIGLVYVYAYIFSLIISTQVSARATVRSQGGASTERVRVGIEGMRDKAAPDTLAGALLRHLVLNDTGIISSLDGVTNEQVANQFKSAYSRILSEHGSQTLVTFDTRQVFLSGIVVNNPYYAAIRTASFLYGHGSGPSVKKIAARGQDAAAQFKYLMGADVNSLLEATFPKEYMPFVRSVIAERSGIEAPPSVDPLWMYNIEVLGLFRTAWGTRPGKGRDILKRREKTILSDMEAVEGISFPDSEGDAAEPTIASLITGQRPPFVHRTNDPMWVGGRVETKKGKPVVKKATPRGPEGRRSKGNWSGRAPSSVRENLFDDGIAVLVHFATEIHSDGDWKAFRQLSAAARNRAHRWQRDISLQSIPTYRAKLPSGSRNFVPEAVNITRIYDQDGEPHTWKKFVWTAVGKKPGEDKVMVLTRNDIQKMIATALAEGKEEPLAGYKFTDWACSACGVRWSETATLDAEKTVRSLLAKSQTDSLFAYFESRCPESGLHAYTGDKCGKCGLDAALLTPAGRKKDAKAARAYFTKYIKVREAEIARKAKVKITADAPAESKKIEPVTLKRDYDAVVAAAGMAEVNIRAIEAIGAAEGRTAEGVSEGEDLPEPPTSLSDQRLLAADGVVKLLVTRYCAYCALRQSSTKARVSVEPWVAELASADEGSGGKFITPQKLDTEGIYFRPYKLALELARSEGLHEDEESGKWPEKLLRFSIESFCRLAVRIAEGGAKKFAIAAIKHAARSELLFSKSLGTFQWAIFGDSDDSRSGLSGNDSSRDDFRRYGEAGTGAEDVMAEEARRRRNAEEGTGDAFSRENVDIDSATAEANLDQ